MVLGCYPPFDATDLNYMATVLIPRSYCQLILLLFATERLWQLFVCQLIFSAHEAWYLAFIIPDQFVPLNFGMYSIFTWFVLYLYSSRHLYLKRSFFLLYWKLKAITIEQHNILNHFPEGILIAQIVENSTPKPNSEDDMNSFFNISIMNYLKNLRLKY